MKVFISWSGEKSRKVAELFKDWLPCVIQSAEPWISSEDIEKGKKWLTEINNALGDTNFGIICLTQSNANKPWILFETGALAKGLEGSHVCTFLVDISPTDIGGPLAQFQFTQFNKKSIHQLIDTINSCGDGKKLESETLNKTFEMFWPQLEEEFNRINEEVKEDAKTFKKRDVGDYLEELLLLVRRIDRKSRDDQDNHISNYTEWSVPQRLDYLRGRACVMCDNGMQKSTIYSKLRSLCNDELSAELIRIIDELFERKELLD